MSSSSGEISQKYIPHHIPNSMPWALLSSHSFIQRFVNSSPVIWVFYLLLSFISLANIQWASHNSFISLIFLEPPSHTRMGLGWGGEYNMVSIQSHVPPTCTLAKRSALSKNFWLRAKCSRLCISNSDCFPELPGFNMPAGFGLIRNVPLTAVPQHGQNRTRAYKSPISLLIFITFCFCSTSSSSHYMRSG